MIQNMKQLFPMLLCALGLTVPSPGGQSVFACNLKAFDAEERKLHDRLTAELRSAAIARREKPNGYSFQMDPAKISFTQIAEWTVLERKCCPFFDYQLDLHSEENTLWFTLKGREGVKKFIEVEVPWTR
jgi:hypothetical protein